MPHTPVNGAHPFYMLHKPRVRVYVFGFAARSLETLAEPRLLAREREGVAPLGICSLVNRMSFCPCAEENGRSFFSAHGKITSASRH